MLSWKTIKRFFIYRRLDKSFFFLVFKNSRAEGKIFNIGSGKLFKLKNIINKIVSYYKSGSPQFNKIKLRKEEQLEIYPRLSKVKRILKWKAKIDFPTGLKRTIQYYNEN